VLPSAGVGTARTTVVVKSLCVIRPLVVRRVAILTEAGPDLTVTKISMNVRTRRATAVQTRSAQTRTDRSLATVSTGISECPAKSSDVNVRLSVNTFYRLCPTLCCQ